MSKINHADDSVHHGVAKSNQGIDSALVQSVYQALKE